MKVAIDAHMVGERETGNETYTLNLVRALLALPDEVTHPLSFSLYTTHPARLHAQLSPADHARVRQIRPAAASLRIPFGMPAATRRDGIDLLHVTYVAPPLGSCPFVVTVHDISYTRYPQFFSPRDRWMLSTLVPLTMRRAARIITVSNHARQEIIDRYGIAPARVAVTYEAAAAQFTGVHDPVQLAGVRARYGVPAAGRYLLALGNLQPRKNMRRLVEAFARLRSQAETTDVQLVIAGKALWRESEVYAAVERLQLTDRVHFVGYVADEDLPALYSGALAFVYPSLYEGFGLPPLEAMACGTPVVCTNVASLPEVVGNAARLITPTDVEDLAQALHAVATDDGLRAALIAQGQHRVAQFSWQRCAAETLAVYREALGLSV
jgi:glycosyltransferase involved in cell wall biosynthesis